MPSIFVARVLPLTIRFDRRFALFSCHRKLSVKESGRSLRCFAQVFLCVNILFSQKIGALNESNVALRERIDILQKEKVRCVICMKGPEKLY